MQFTLTDKIYLVALIIFIVLNINWYLTLFFIRLDERRKTHSLKKDDNEINFFTGEQGTGKKIPAEVLSDLYQQRWFLELDEETQRQKINELHRKDIDFGINKN